MLTQPGWGRHLSRVFRTISEVIVPFYGEARVNRAEYRGPTRYIEHPAPITARYWYGFPWSVPFAMVVGPPYLQAWDLPGGGADGELLFYSSGSWPGARWWRTTGAGTVPSGARLALEVC